MTLSYLSTCKKNKELKMSDREFTCEDCDAEFDIEYDFAASIPEFCPFCATKLSYDDVDLDIWDDEDSDKI